MEESKSTGAARPTWEDYFLGLAFAIAERSMDHDTHHGAIITDRKNHILGTGYNSFPMGFDDETLPTTRPDKYLFMCHAEQSAIAQSPCNLWGMSDGCVLFITGTPCHVCLKSIIQSNIRKIVMVERQGTQLENEDTLRACDLMIKQSGIEIIKLRPNLRWLKDLVGKLEKDGFIQ
jgi:dCMP deaminase